MKDPVTTITGSVLLVVSALALYGVISNEEAGSISEYAVVIINAVAGIVAIFAKDKATWKAKSDDRYI